MLAYLMGKVFLTFTVLNQTKELFISIEAQNILNYKNEKRNMEIGIAVTTTPCRSDVFDKWYLAYKNTVASIPLYIHNDTEYKGISYSKNRCIASLYDSGVDAMFLFDDDLIINNGEFIERYINSGLEHACWNYNKRLTGSVYNYNTLPDHLLYDKPNGCMLYATRKVIDTVGGWDTDFKGYGYDHVNWSDRIFNNGLTPGRYIDIPNSSHFFKMQNCETSVSADIRMATIPVNEKLYREKFYSKKFKPYK